MGGTVTLPFALGTLHVESPGFLVGLLAVPLFVIAARGATAAGVVRALAFTVLLGVLAGVSVERARPAAGTCVVAAIDVSASVGDGAADAARTFLTGVLRAMGPGDLVGTVAFAGRAEVVAEPAPAPQPLDRLVPRIESAGFEPEETDLAGALAIAAPLCPDDKAAAVLLFTDGNETTGSLRAEAALASSPVPVFPVVPPAAALPVATVRRLRAPAFAPAHGLVPLEAVLENQATAPVTALLRLRANGRALMPLPVELPPGASLLALPFRTRDPGQLTFDAELEAVPDGPRVAGRARATVAVTRPLTALVVSERAEPVVAEALARRGLDVDAVAPAAFEARVGTLGAYHLVVLDDVAHAGFGDDSLAALARWVEGGGGLVVTGGPHLFGDAGFATSPLADVLPVELQSQTPEPEEREPLALFLLVDRSNSMGYQGEGLRAGEKMEYAKAAALAVLDQLAPQDLVGAIAFDAEPHELAALRPVGQSRGALAAKIQQLQYGGGTDFLDALEAARQSLVASAARVRHVILLTDGDTNRHTEDHAALIAELARDEITVTTIRIGDDTANLELLEGMARATGGAFHHVERVAALPQLMIRDAQRLMNRAAGHEETPVRIGAPGSILAGIREEELPPAIRWAVTRPRTDTELRLWVEAGDRHDPLLATWQYGLGRVAVLPLDFHSSNVRWTAWPGFGKLWTQLALWAAPPALAGDHRLAAHHHRDGTLVSLDAAADEPGPFTLRFPHAPDVVLQPTGRRRFVAFVPELPAGTLPARLRRGTGAAAVEKRIELAVPASTASGREGRATAPDAVLLAQVAAATGGRVDPEPADVFAARPGVARERRSLDGVLVPLVLALILLDVALRRRSAGRFARPTTDAGTRGALAEARARRRTEP
jgi:Mg-chelatase subunit ChlD